MAPLQVFNIFLYIYYSRINFNGRARECGEFSMNFRNFRNIENFKNSRILQTVSAKTRTNVERSENMPRFDGTDF